MPTLQRLLGSALLYLIVLAFFGALRWSSPALILFAGLWVVQAIGEFYRHSRATARE